MYIYIYIYLFIYTVYTVHTYSVGKVTLKMK